MVKNLVKRVIEYGSRLIVREVNSHLEAQLSALLEMRGAPLFQEKKAEAPVFFLAGPGKVPVVFVHNSYGQRVCLDPADYFICIHYLEHLDWEEHLEEVYCESLSGGGMYLDIGGNIGLHVLRAHRLGASRIFAFEPNPNTFDILSLNMQLNGMHSGFFNFALGEADGIAGMNVTSYSAGMARIEKGGSNLLDVSVRSLDSFSTSHPALLHEKLALVKIDVEGHEGEVIDGAIDFFSRHANFNIIIEFGSSSSVRAVQALNQVFSFTMKLYRWKQAPIDVDMDFVNDQEKRIGGDLVLFCLKKIQDRGP